MIAEIILIAFSIPVGFLLAWLARDEIISLRYWLLILFMISAVISIVFFYFKSVVAANTLVFMAIVSFISYWKSFDKKWAIRAFR